MTSRITIRSTGAAVEHELETNIADRRQVSSDVICLRSPLQANCNMNLLEVESKFWALVDQANSLDTEAWRIKIHDDADPVDTNRLVEPTFSAICELVTDHSAMRESFVRWFSELVLQKRKSPWMLVPFCMRVLRMPEVKDVLHREMDERGHGTERYAQLMNYCSSIMHAYDDDVWENAIAFDTFAHELES